MSGTSDLSLYRRLLHEARAYWPHIGGILVLGLLATPIALLAPVPLKIAVDSVLGSKPLPGFLQPIVPGFAVSSNTRVLVFAVCLLVAVALLNQLQILSSSFLETYIGEKLVLAFRARLFRHVQRLSLAFHDLRGTTDSIYRIQYDAGAIQWIAVYGVTPFITAAFTFLAMLYVMVRIDWALALVALVVAPPLVFLTRFYKQRLRRGWTQVKELESSALEVVEETLGALRVVKAFGQEEREHERFMTRSSQSVRAQIRISLTDGALGLLVGLGTTIGTAAVLFIGIRHVQSGAITLGELLLVMGYLTQLYTPLQTISRSIATLQSSLASAERAFSLLDEQVDVPERPDARPLPRTRGAVAFEHVSFAYGAGPDVLHDVSFELDPGASLGIAGATGAGKTTLVSLLARFYDPTSGGILLDGTDLRAYRLVDLRDQFAIVLQEPVLFSTTIAENIAYGRPGAGSADVVSAARAANADDFIRRLPDGYDTVVGERGMRLSGGERQRISLARAFLKDAPILILDEPTSSVDLQTEASIMDAMGRLMRGRTTVMIAHRLSTLERCDTLLELDRGHVAGMYDSVSELAAPHRRQSVEVEPA